MEQQHTLTQHALSMLDKGSTRADIIASLMDRGHDEPFVRELVTEVARQYSLKRRTQGFALILTGAVICLLSCVTTLVSATGVDSLKYALYGATTLGIAIVFAGLMKIF